MTFEKRKTKQNKQKNQIALEMLELALTWKIVSVRNFPGVTCQLQMFAKVAQGLFTIVNGLDKDSTTLALTRIYYKRNIELKDNQEKK